jgi:glyoxylase-like metal-dependent hydrolase (beta-lactamase superfamily II)
VPDAVTPDFVVGDIEVARVVEFEVPAPADRPLPGWMAEGGFTDGPGAVRIASTGLVVRAGGRTIVVDPWLVFDGDPADAAALAARAEAVASALASAGLAPDDVDLVVNTHVDGIGLNVRPAPGGAPGMVPTFPRARYLFSTAELDLSAGDARLDPLRGAGLIDAVSPPVEVAPGVILEEAPGHRPGHMAVRLRSRGAEALVPGHLVISPLQVADPAIALDEHPAEATATRRRLLGELAERAGVLIGSLIGGPGGGRVGADSDTWRLTPPR